MILKWNLKLFLFFILSIISFNALALTLTSTAFQNNEIIPSSYTCDGKNILPPLSWNNIPATTKSFAITITDPDAPAGVWTHWVIYNIPANVNTISSNISSLPANSIELNNSWKQAKYDGPCPPSGTHHYWFTLYALDETLKLSPDANRAILDKNMQNHILAKATLIGLYARQ